MLISHKHKFVFASVPKTASTSITNVLEDYSDISFHNDKEKLIIHYPVGWQSRIKVFKHARLEHVNEFINLDNYFSFCFVRNPFEIALSNYFFFQKTIEFWDKNPKEKDLYIDIYNGYTATLKNAPTFKDWIKKKNKAGWLDKYSWETEQFFWAQDVDFIGKFENLQQDFNIACSKIGIPLQQLPYKNQTDHKHYTEYYDDEAREIVSKKYKTDMLCFGYKFGD